MKIIKINQFDKKDIEILNENIPGLDEAEARLEILNIYYNTQTSFKSNRIVNNSFEISKSDSIKITDKYIIKIIDL
jgi:hypothetical protein